MGFLTCLNDILIPHLKCIVELGFAQTMMVQFAFFSSFFVFAQPPGKLVQRIDYKRTMVTGLLVMAVGALLLVPAASIASFPLFLGALIVLAAGITRVRASRLLALVAFIAAVLVITTMLTLGNVAVWSVILVGLFNSVMFPSIFTIDLEGLGPLTSKGSSLMVMAIVGGVILPVAQGFLADRFGVHHAFILPVLCYLYIAIFGLTRASTSLTAATT